MGGCELSEDTSSSSRSKGAYPRRCLLGTALLVLVLGAPSAATAVTMALHLAEAPPEGFADASSFHPAEPATPRLNDEPGTLGTTAGGSAETPATAEAEALPRRPMPSLAAFPGQVGRDFVHLVVRPFDFDTQDWTRFAVGAGAVGVAALLDSRIHNWVQGSGSASLATHIRPIGTWGGLAVMGAALAAGGIFGNSNLASMGLDGIEASLFSAGVITPVLKEIAGRTRPNAGQGASEFEPLSHNQSFPSGEVTLAFTNAAVISGYTDSVVVRGIAWGLAGLVGWERMRMDAHWASDVVAGALIGTAVGSWIVKIHTPSEGGPHTTVSVLPTVGPYHAIGATASISW